MANFVLVYKGGGMPETEAEQQAVLADWGRWYESIGAGVVDGGQPFGSAASVGADGSVSAGGASGLTGYSILAADSLDAATALAQTCPIRASGGSIEVYEAMPMM